MRIFGRVFGMGAGLAHARAAEVRGDLAHAAVLFAQAGRFDEAARVMVLRGDAETDPATRLRHYVQAVTTAPEGSEVHTHARRKRASTVLAIAADAPLTTALKQDLAEAAGELEEIGDHTRAADAYTRVGDVDGQVRALGRAGELERLDTVLAAQHGRDRDIIAGRRDSDEVDALVASGRRREAVRIARGSTDEGLRGRGRSLEQRRVAGSVVHARLRGSPLNLALGHEVVIGRYPRAFSEDPSPPGQALITLSSAAVSRRHLVIRRAAGPGGSIIVRDLGSRNGTTLRGVAVSGEVAVESGIEVCLGGDVTIVLRPASEFPDAVAIEAAGLRWIAPLGPAMLGQGQWRLERGDDDWVELSTDDDPPAFEGPMLLASRVTLLVGDVIATERGGPPILEVVEREQ